MTTYKDAGVDTEAGQEAVRRIKKLVERTWKHVRGTVVDAGFVGKVVCRDDGTVCTVKTDSAGTKVLIAYLMGVRDWIGQDAVAMTVNDLAAGGLMPELLVDCILMGKQVPEETYKLVEGVANGCIQARCGLINGEMAELPGMLRPGEFEMATAAYGYATSFDQVITGRDIRPGMGIFGIPSSGVHSNGISLIRKAFGIDAGDPARSREVLSTYYADLGMSLGHHLLIPTRIYVEDILDLRKRFSIKGAAHITGGGVREKLPRILPPDCAASLAEAKHNWRIPPIFQIIAHRAQIDLWEMLRTFNCGMGFIVISPDDLSAAGLRHLGEVVRLPDDGKRILLPY